MMTPSSVRPDDYGGDDDEGRAVKFVPPRSSVESAFWVRYCRAKLETIRLGEGVVPIRLSRAAAVRSGGNGGGFRLDCRADSLLLPAAGE